MAEREPDWAAAKRGRKRIGSTSPARARQQARGKKSYRERLKNETPDQRRARIAQKKARLKERAQAIDLGKGPPMRFLINGGKGARLSLLHTPFADSTDSNDEFAMVWQSRYSELISHLGGESELSLPQRRIADHAARLSLIADTAWTAVKRDGVVKTRNVKGQPTGAVETYFKAVRGEIEILRLIGVERRSKHVPTLAEIMATPSTIEQPPSPGGDADADENAEGDAES